MWNPVPKLNRAHSINVNSPYSMWNNTGGISNDNNMKSTTNILLLLLIKIVSVLAMWSHTTLTGKTSQNLADCRTGIADAYMCLFRHFSAYYSDIEARFQSKSFLVPNHLASTDIEQCLISILLVGIKPFP